MPKIIILGIDGLDPFLINEWKLDLPHFHKLLEQYSNIFVESTFPPDSICAWASIFTGENPAEHGLIESIDYLAAKKNGKRKDRTVAFKGKTFWDIASSNGKKVCVINPFLAYPAWSVNGCMVSGPVFETGDISAIPSDILSRFEFPPLGGMVDFPAKKELGSFVTEAIVVTKQLAEVGLKLYEHQNPDLFFLTFLTLDRIKHFLWRFTDTNDPYFQSRNRFRNVIKDFYRLFDSIIGSFLSRMGKNTVMIVMSDHGHRRRCSMLFNLNEWLRQNHYITTNGKGINRFAKIIAERAKVFTITALARWSLEDWIYRIAKLVPNRKSLKNSMYLVDKDKSRVFLARICGANPFGGVDINIQDSEEYEKTRDDIIRKLLAINESMDKKVVLWAKRREDVYEGQFSYRLPDVVFELDGDYGVGMNFYVPLITTNYTYKKISGGHKTEATFIAYSSGGPPNVPRPRTVMEVHKYILTLLEISDPEKVKHEDLSS